MPVVVAIRPMNGHWARAQGASCWGVGLGVWLLLGAGCHALRWSDPLAPVHPSGGQLVLHGSVPRTHQPLVEELVALRQEVLEALGVPGSQRPIHIYLFPSQAQLDAFRQSRFPHFPARRAFFVQSDEDLRVYAAWGPRVAEDLRHEVVHGYLHSVLPQIPLWLDEGLAEYFETPRPARGLHLAHAHLLAEHLALGWKPNLTRLEQLSSAAQMNQRDYAESWAWVHFLLHSTPQRRQMFQSYMNRLASGQQSLPLSRVWKATEPDLNTAQALQQHLIALLAQLRRSRSGASSWPGINPVQ